MRRRSSERMGGLLWRDRRPRLHFCVSL
jgi:hypothetical protein